MRTKYTCSLPVNLVERLNLQLRPGSRSRFIEMALKNRLDRFEDTTISDIPDRQILAILLARDLDPLLNKILLHFLEMNS